MVCPPYIRCYFCYWIASSQAAALLSTGYFMTPPRIRWHPDDPTCHLDSGILLVLSSKMEMYAPLSAFLSLSGHRRDWSRGWEQWRGILMGGNGRSVSPEGLPQTVPSFGAGNLWRFGGKFCTGEAWWLPKAQEHVSWFSRVPFPFEDSWFKLAIAKCRQSDNDHPHISRSCCGWHLFP